MYIKIYNCSESGLIQISDNCNWRLYVKSFDENGHDDYSLYLTVDGDGKNDKTYLISDSDKYCSGRDIPKSEVGELYKDVLDNITKKIIDIPDLYIIDIPNIEAELIEKYLERWKENGWIIISENGTW